MRFTTSMLFGIVALAGACDSTKGASPPAQPAAGTASEPAAEPDDRSGVERDGGLRGAHDRDALPPGLPPPQAPPNEPRNQQSPPNSVIPDKYPPGEQPAP
jgi:hypothetical protein